MTNHNDFARDKILRFLYQKHRTARGPKAVAVGIRNIQTAMKNYKLKNYEVTSHLDYLVQKEWIKPVVEQRLFTTPKGTTLPVEKTRYKISDIGIDRLEEASIFKRQNGFSGINITNLNGVTVVGSGNIVNADLTDFAKALQRLEDALKTSNQLSEEDKLNAIADIASIQSQLAKPKPDHRIIRTLWTGIEKIATIAGLIDLVAQISKLVA